LNQFVRTALIVSLFLAAIACTPNVAWQAKLRARSTALADSLIRSVTPWEVPSRTFLVEDHGAVPDGRMVNTRAIQMTIDECADAGGGVVLFSSGDYVTGTIVLRSNVMLEIGKGAKILGSTDLSDYPEHIETLKSFASEQYMIRQSLIYAENVTNTGIRGKGEIDFRGGKANFPGGESTGQMLGRPLGIRVIGSKGFVMQDITLRNSAAWMEHYLASEDLFFDGIKVINHANFNNDGLDLDSCRNVVIRNAFINAEDDAMCLKGSSGQPSENILIENSTFVSSCNALKIGTETLGSFHDIVVRDVVLGGIPDGLQFSQARKAISGINLSTVDGGDVEDIVIDNAEIDRAECPIFIRAGNRGRNLAGTGERGPGHLRRILIEHVRGSDNLRQGSFISGLKGDPIEDVLISDMTLSMSGGGTAEMANTPVVESPTAYPDAKMFSADGLPAYGFFIRHARDVTIDNGGVDPTTPDARRFALSGGDTSGVVINGHPLTES